MLAKKRSWMSILSLKLVKQFIERNKPDRVSRLNDFSGRIIDQAIAPYRGREDGRTLIGKQIEPALGIDSGTQEFIAPVCFRPCEIGTHGKRFRHDIDYSLQSQNKWPHKEQEGDEAGNRVAGQPQKECGTLAAR